MDGQTGRGVERVIALRDTEAGEAAEASGQTIGPGDIARTGVALQEEILAEGQAAQPAAFARRRMKGGKRGVAPASPTDGVVETAVEKQIAELQKALKIIDHKCDYYRRAVEAGTEKDMIGKDELPYAGEFLRPLDEAEKYESVE